ncbi:MAG: thioredoxin [Chloroflexota bacterium]
MATIDVTDSTFQSEVLDSDKPVLVDFWADWCGPCRMIAPSIKDISEEYGETLKVAKVDVDDNPAVPGRYGVVGIPTLMLFKGGEVVERVTGAMPKDSIVAKVLPHINE